MLSALFAISWDPNIRGIIVVLCMFLTLCGGTYLVIGTNLGARLGILVSVAALFGWLATMGAIWMVYGIGLKGREPTWKPANPISIIRDGTYLNSAEVIDVPIKVAAGSSPAEVAATVKKQLEAENGYASTMQTHDADKQLHLQTTSFKIKRKSLLPGNISRCRYTTAVESVHQRSMSHSTSLRFPQAALCTRGLRRYCRNVLNLVVRLQNL